MKHTTPINRRDMLASGSKIAVGAVVAASVALPRWEWGGVTSDEALRAAGAAKLVLPRIANERP
ncbi:MAG: hypothetical protein JKX93_08485 [Rhizobiaceae bacterium]|nr:hypothetical protein [Rhizobiaceae bacterium]